MHTGGGGGVPLEKNVERRWPSKGERLQEKSNLLTPLILDFQPPELWENTALLCKPRSLHYSVMAAQQTNKSLNSDSLQVDIFYPLISYTHLQQQDLWVYIKKKKYWTVEILLRNEWK